MNRPAQKAAPKQKHHRVTVVIDVYGKDSPEEVRQWLDERLDVEGFVISGDGPRIQQIGDHVEGLPADFTSQWLHRASDVRMLGKPVTDLQRADLLAIVAWMSDSQRRRRQQMEAERQYLEAREEPEKRP